MKRFLKISYVLAVYAFLYVPIIILILYSFNKSRYGSSWIGFTLKWYKALFNNTMLIEAFLNSIKVAVCSSLIATLLGTVTAVVLYRYRFAGRKALHTLIYYSLMSPDIVMGISLLMFFILVGMETGFLTLLVAHVTFSFPFVMLIVYARLKGFDHSIIDAAKDLGAGEFQIFRYILFPLVLPAVLAGWLLGFALSLDDVIVSFFVTGPMYEILPIKIYSMVKLGVKPEVNALCAILLVLTLCSIIIANFLFKEKNR